jgi:serine/threonine protein kinase
MAAGGGKQSGAAPGITTATASSASAASEAARPGAGAASDCLSRQVIVLGYDRNIDEKYTWGQELGKGGNGVVRVVRDRATGEEYACKSIAKVLPPGAAASESKRAGHVESIKREIEVMRRLAGSLAIVRLVDVYEGEGGHYG